MLSAPTDLDEGHFADALAESWDFAASSLTYQAIGAGSHHWVAGNGTGDRLFVTVDDLAEHWAAHEDPDAVFQRVEAAFLTARALRDEAKLTFVVPPRPQHDRTVLRRLSRRYALAVYPYLDVIDPAGFGRVSDPAALEMVTAMHAASTAVSSRLRPDDFALPLRAELDRAIADVDHTWKAGPYANPTRDLLTRHRRALEQRLEAHDHRVATVHTSEHRVITHGEPHAGNVIVTTTGWALVDWDTAVMAPPERDLWWLLDSADDAGAQAYSSATGIPVRAELLELYRLAWDLTDICIYVATLRRPHADTADTAKAWRHLVEAVERDV